MLKPFLNIKCEKFIALLPWNLQNCKVQIEDWFFSKKFLIKKFMEIRYFSMEIKYSYAILEITSKSSWMCLAQSLIWNVLEWLNFFLIYATLELKVQYHWTCNFFWKSETLHWNPSNAIVNYIM